MLYIFKVFFACYGDMTNDSNGRINFTNQPAIFTMTSEKCS